MRRIASGGRQSPSTTSRGRRARRWRTILRILIAVVASLVSAGSVVLLGVFAMNPDGMEEYTIGRRPSTFLRAFELEDRIFPDQIYADVLGVAHNSGGRIEATLEALIFGADVIEVDVVAVDGVLYSAHKPPLPFIGPRFFRGPSLEQVWTASYRASAFKMDLKEDSPEYVELVAQFLNSRLPNREVIVASRSTIVLAALREKAPQTTLLLSVPDTEALDALQASSALQFLVDGVTIRESLLDSTNTLWLKDRGLMVIAWTVNDIERVNQLVYLGVDGITTDNLAILTLLGGQMAD
jgi:hypothetical protein